MADKQDRYGVSGAALSVPGYCVQLEDWCSWYDRDWSKIQAVVGRSFRIPDDRENVYTLAANAVLKLIVNYDVDPQRVGFLGFGTESSTDNSAGAVIVRGMVDRALEALGRPRLARNLEVPEFKHACLGGVYAQKAALRYLACDGGERQAIVVAGDIAEYARGSSGEQTQGAGALAMLLERDPKLYAINLRQTGSASSYRGPDFRKPFRRHFVEGGMGQAKKMHDFPVFNGKYSTTCYIDATIWAMRDMLEKQRTDAPSLFDQVDGIYLHRPYHHMPVAALAAMYVFGLSAPEHHQQLKQLCADAELDWSAVREELGSQPDLFEQVLAGEHDRDAYPSAMKLVKSFRRSQQFKKTLRNKMALGSDLMMELGNLYTASLPVWIAAGFEEALESEQDLLGKRFLSVGYGSGDAAEAAILEVMPGWKEAAGKMGLRHALAEPKNLNQNEYEALHDGTANPNQPHRPQGGFVIEKVGTSNESAFQDIGIEYYRYVDSTTPARAFASSRPQHASSAA